MMVNQLDGPEPGVWSTMLRKNISPQTVLQALCEARSPDPSAKIPESTVLQNKDIYKYNKTKVQFPPSTFLVPKSTFN